MCREYMFYFKFRYLMVIGYDLNYKSYNNFDFFELVEN